MSWAGRSIRRRSQATISALPARACHGQAPRPDGPAPAHREVGARPSARPRPSASSSAGSKEPSPSMKATRSAVAASSPACTAAPYPGVALADHGRPEPARDVGGAVARAVVDHDHRGTRPGPRAAARSRAAASSRQGSTRSHTTGLLTHPPAVSPPTLAHTRTMSNSRLRRDRAVARAGRLRRSRLRGIRSARHCFGLEVASRAPRSASPDEVPPLHGLWEPKLFGPGTLPAVRDRACWAGGTPPTWPTGCPGAGCWPRRTSGRWPGCCRWRSWTARGDLAGAGQPVRVPADRALGRQRVAPARHLHQPDPATPRRQLAHPRGRPPARARCCSSSGWSGSGWAATSRRGWWSRCWPRRPPPAVLVTLRALGAEALARRAAPFLVLTPAAVFMAVSADALIAAVVAWGLACLALAPRAAGLWWAVPAGLLLGTAVMMSYGMPLIGLLALAVLVAARSWRPLPVARRLRAGGGAGLRRARLRVVGRLPGAQGALLRRHRGRPAAVLLVVRRPGLPGGQRRSAAAAGRLRGRASPRSLGPAYRRRPCCCSSARPSWWSLPPTPPG